MIFKFTDMGNTECRESFSWCKYIFVLRHIEFDVPVSHKGECLECKKNLNNKSENRSNLKIYTSESHQHTVLSRN